MEGGGEMEGRERRGKRRERGGLSGTSKKVEDVERGER